MATKFSQTEIKEHIKRVQDVVEKNRRENEGEHFTAVTPEEIERKLTRTTRH